MVQLALRVEKLTGEKRSRGSFQKRKGLDFTSKQSSKKSRSSDSFGNSFRSGTNSVSSLQSIPSSQPSKLRTSPQGFDFRGRTMTKRSPRCQQYHTGTCGMPQVCFQCGQIGVKSFYLMMSWIGLMGQSLA